MHMTIQISLVYLYPESPISQIFSNNRYGIFVGVVTNITCLFLDLNNEIASGIEGSK